MWLVLAHQGDATAWWAWQALAAQGLAPVEFVTVEELTSRARWVHTVDVEGARFEVRLARGQVLNSERIDGVLNRIGFVPPSAVAAFDIGDRDYASQELNAFFLSWLATLRGPVLNQPTARGLAGAWRSPVEWAWLAGKCGLPIAPYLVAPGGEIDTVVPGDIGFPPITRPALLAIVIGDQVVGADVPSDTHDGCRRLAREAGTPILGVRFEPDPDGRPAFAGADLSPPLEYGGEALVEALAKTLREGPAW